MSNLVFFFFLGNLQSRVEVESPATLRILHMRPSRLSVFYPCKMITSHMFACCWSFYFWSRCAQFIESSNIIFNQRWVFCIWMSSSSVKYFYSLLALFLIEACSLTMHFTFSSIYLAHCVLFFFHPLLYFGLFWPIIVTVFNQAPPPFFINNLNDSNIPSFFYFKKILSCYDFDPLT